MTDWYLYLVRTRHNTLYTGIATDVMRRLREHTEGRNASSRYLRGRGPLQLAYEVNIGCRSTALRVEYAVKQLSRRDKEALILAAPDRERLLQHFNIQE